MNGLIGLLSSIIVRYIDRDFEEEEVRVAYIGHPSRVFVEDDYVELLRGSEYSLPRWMAYVLGERNRAKVVEVPIDEVMVSRLYFNEIRDRGRLKFEKLTGHFYSRVKQQLSSMMKAYKEIDDLSKAHQVVQSITNLSTSTKNLYKARLSKLLALVGGEVSPDLFNNLSEEEKHLLLALRNILEIFNTQVFEVEKRG